MHQIQESEIEELETQKTQLLNPVSLHLEDNSLVPGLNEEINQLELELMDLKKQQQHLDVESSKLDEMEHKFWVEFNEYQRESMELHEETSTLMHLLEKMSKQMEMLKNANVFRDLFHISQVGMYGTISGFKLGTVCPETSAGWGQCCLFLCLLSSELPYKITPRGSTSFITNEQDFFFHKNLESSVFLFLKNLKYVQEKRNLNSKWDIPQRAIQQDIVKVSRFILCELEKLNQ